MSKYFNKSTQKFWLPAILLLNIFLLSRIKFTAWPEMMLWPYLMLKGWLPYKDIAIAHNPFLLVVLTLFNKVFGVGLLQLKTFTWLVITASDLTVFYVARRLWNKRMAFLTILFIALLQIYFDANGLWFDLALIPLFTLIYFYLKEGKIKLVGIFWILSFLVKQTSVFILPIIVWELLNSKTNFRKNVEKLFLGMTYIFIPFLVLLLSINLFDDWFFWTIKFAGGILPFSEGQIQSPTTTGLIINGMPILLSLYFTVTYKDKKLKNLLFWSIFSSLGAYPRWESFHLLPSTPFLSFTFAISALKIKSIIKPSDIKKFTALLLTAIFLTLFVRKATNDIGKETRFMEKNVIEVSEFIKSDIEVGEEMFILNSWEHFYVLTNTLPTTDPWVPQFSWYLSIPNVEEEMLSQLIIDPPEYIIMHPYSDYGLDSYKPEKLSDFIDRYYYPVKSFGTFEIIKRR